MAGHRERGGLDKHQYTRQSNKDSILMDGVIYEARQRMEFERYEGICKRCGECCGSADGDPCANLRLDLATGKYYCSTYDSRLGPQKTVSGAVFTCVPIRGIIRQGLLRPDCAYNKTGG